VRNIVRQSTAPRVPAAVVGNLVGGVRLCAINVFLPVWRSSLNNTSSSSRLLTHLAPSCARLIEKAFVIGSTHPRGIVTYALPRVGTGHTVTLSMSRLVRDMGHTRRNT
jgi:hypothetical protein